MGKATDDLERTRKIFPYDSYLPWLTIDRRKNPYKLDVSYTQQHVYIDLSHGRLCF